MLGLNILLHSVKLVFLNWKTALRISSPLIANTLVLGILFGGLAANVSIENPGPDFPWLIFVLFSIGQVVAGLWVAVAWHRYVLLEEDSGSLLPRFMGGRIGAYLLQGIFLGVIVMLVAVVVGAVVGLAFAAVTGVGGIILTTVVVTGVALWIFYRLSPTLPAAALGEEYNIGDAWRATKSYSGAILTMVIIMSVASALFGSLVTATVDISMTVYLVFSVIQTWVSLMLGISVLTTIYGVAVENREL